MACIENLLDEVFHEIFNYLDDCHIYEAFSNFNHRFEQLLHSPLLLYKIDEVNIFFSSFIIDSLFNRLELFAVRWIDPDLVIPLLVN
jgi:hypothetical protein